MDIKNTQAVTDHIETAIRKGKSMCPKLPDSVLRIESGMFCNEARHFLNAICSFRGCRYLEIGSYRGASLISALYRNADAYGVAIDNFSRFDENGVNEGILTKNIAMFSKDINANFMNQDCWSIDLSIFKTPFNVYFYDGPHSVENHKMAFTYFDAVLEDEFIVIIDDYSLMKIRIATQTTFETLGYRVVYEKILNIKSLNIPHHIYVGVINKK